MRALAAAVGVSLSLGLSLGAASASAQSARNAEIARSAPSDSGWQFGAVLDTGFTSKALELGGRDKGLQLGHSDLNASGRLGRHFDAGLSASFATHEGTLERGVEEAWLETRTLPAGLSARVGRFASQIGAINAQHPHADDFVERPLLYRAFLGGHWNDDGLRLNITLPTGLYWTLGAEVFRGRRLVSHADPAVSGVGAATLATKIGGDLGRSQSWQLGLSMLHSRRIAALEEHGDHGDEDEEDHDHEHDHEGDHAGHDHGAAYGGRRMWLADATWKWAPDGNNREQQVRVSVEAARVSGINRFATGGQHHDALAVAAVWRFAPNWEVGARVDRLRVAMPHEDTFEDGRLREQSLMLAWKPSHLQTLRLQATRQHGAVGFESPAARSLALQYVLAFGAHGAHAY
jgi:hypothetical protein